MELIGVKAFHPPENRADDFHAGEDRYADTLFRNAKLPDLSGLSLGGAVGVAAMAGTKKGSAPHSFRRLYRTCTI